MAVCRNTVKNPSQCNKEGKNGTKYMVVAYCIPILIRLFSRDGWFASTCKLSTGDVLNAPSERRNPR
jgi:hypothetical protein